MRWTAHSMCCSLLSLNAHLFSWPLILVRVLSTSSRSPNYLKTISANLPPHHWEMKRKLFFLFCVRFRKAERGRWGQEMTKELITEVYSYFSPVHIFRDVRTKKQSAEQDIKRVKVTKILQFRLMNFLWGFTFCGPHLCDIFTMDLSLMSQFMRDLSADGWRRWKIRVLLANMYHHVADFFRESLYCIEMVLFHHAVSTKHSMRCPVENSQDVICPRESMCVPVLRHWGHMGRLNSNHWVQHYSANELVTGEQMLAQSGCNEPRKWTGGAQLQRTI